MSDEELSEDVVGSANETSTGEVIDRGDRELPAIQYSNSLAESDRNNKNSTKESPREKKKAGSCHVGQDEFLDDVTELERTTLFPSKCYKVYIRRRATERVMLLTMEIFVAEADRNLITEDLFPPYSCAYTKPFKTPYGQAAIRNSWRTK